MHGRDPHGDARRAVQREPADAMAWIVLAEHELDAGDARAGAAAAQRALALRPGHPEALARLGRAHWMQGHHDLAVASLRAAAGAPGHPGIAVWLGHALEDSGEAEAAADAYARAHALAPHEPQLAAYLLAWRRKLCDWRGLEALSRQVRDAVRGGHAAVEPFAFLSEDGSAAEQLQCARLRAAQVARAVQPLPSLAIAAGGVLRVGFLSNGLGAHPTGLLTVALFEALRSQPADIEVHLFALNRDEQPDPPAPAGRRARAARRRRAAACRRRRAYPSGADRRAVRPARLGRRRRAGSAGDAPGAGAGELARLPRHLGRAMD